jgi:beta-glucosidase
VLNVGDKSYDPLFAYGYGLSYAKPGKVAMLSESSGLAAGADLPVGTWFERGKTAPNLDFYAGVGSAAYRLKVGVGTSADSLRIFAVDRNRQEDSRRVVWAGNNEASLVLSANTPLDLSRETNGAVAIEIDYKVDAIGDGPVRLLAHNADLQASGEGINIEAQLNAARGNGWQTLSIPLSCFAKAGLDMSKLQSPLSIKSAAVLDMTVSRIALGTSAKGMVACP